MTVVALRSIGSPNTRRTATVSRIACRISPTSIGALACFIASVANRGHDPERRVELDAFNGQMVCVRLRDGGERLFCGVRLRTRQQHPSHAAVTEQLDGVFNRLPCEERLP